MFCELSVLRWRKTAAWRPPIGEMQAMIGQIVAGAYAPDVVDTCQKVYLDGQLEARADRGIAETLPPRECRR